MAIKAEKILTPKEVIELICNPSLSLYDLASKGLRASLISGFSPCFGIGDQSRSNYESNGRKLKFLYGINVRTPNNLGTILPFFKTSDERSEANLDKSLRSGKISKDRSVPKLAEEFGLRELLVMARRDIANKDYEYAVCDDDIHILSYKREDNGYLDSEQVKALRGFLSDPASFFSVQVKSMEIFGRIYLWITSEDYNVAEKGVSLSNMIAITNNYDAMVNSIIPNRPSFTNFLFLIKARYLYDMERKRRDSAIKSAKAAIMSRNMSHNLGSHVMYYIKQKLHDVQKILDEGVLKNLSDIDLTNIKSLNDVVNNKTCMFEMPFLVGLGRFINYLQERQDYIATVATDYIPANSTISFKDFVYDELKPDLRYERHKIAGSSTSETSRQQPKNLLLDYIAKSEGYNGSEKIKIRFGEFDGTNPPFLKDESGAVTKEYDTETSMYKSFRQLRDFNVALPGGVIGRQALFSIMENIIRNAAKHSYKRNDGLLAIDFNVLDYDDDSIYEGLRFVDPLRPNDPEQSTEELKARYLACRDKYYLLSITNNMPNEASKVDTLVKSLATPYINDDATMEDSGKGLKEIRISASWLRRYQHDLDIPATEPPAIAIKAEPYEGTAHVKIKYYICLPRPKSVVYVVPKGFLSDEALLAYNSVLNKLGCTIVLSEKSILDKSALYDYDIVVICDSDFNAKRLLPELSSRFITSRTKQEAKANLQLLKSVIDIIDANASNDAITHTVSQVYKVWSDRMFAERKHRLVILDDKAKVKSQNEPYATYLSNNEDFVLGDTEVKDSSYFNGSIVYSTHYQSMYNSGKSEMELRKNSAFIEGITGNNSTDRLIRQTVWNDEWKYKQIAAGLSRVAILDERIFGTINPKIDELDMEFLNNYLGKIRESELQGASFLEEFYTAVYQRYGALPVMDEFMSRFAECETIEKEHVVDWFKQRSNYNYELTRKYHEGNVWAFDIVVPKGTRNEVNIIGYDTKISDSVGMFDPHDKIDVLMKITGYKSSELHKDNVTRKLKVKISIFNKSLMRRANRFDLITIHQGILDKIYSALDIKSEPANKEILTKVLYEALAASPETIKLVNNYDYESYYLPRFIIHSGRSKPGYHDMPQHQPFVQFAAVDHAVRDCKYTLSELLYSAHYEKGDNNN